MHFQKSGEKHIRKDPHDDMPIHGKNSIYLLIAEEKQFEALKQSPIASLRPSQCSEGKLLGHIVQQPFHLYQPEISKNST